jgi:hypothetical protein
MQNISSADAGTRIEVKRVAEFWRQRPDDPYDAELFNLLDRVEAGEQSSRVLDIPPPT